MLSKIFSMFYVLAKFLNVQRSGYGCSGFGRELGLYRL